MKFTLGLSLALRLARTTVQRNVSASLVQVAGVAVLTLLGLMALAVPQVIERQGSRDDALTPRVQYDQPASETTQLLTVDPLATPAERWNGHEVERQYYAATHMQFGLPGVASVPEPGTYYASPELNVLLKTDPAVRSLFAPLEKVGAIAEQGLIEPHQIKAIIGVERDDRLLLRPVEGFGSEQEYGSSDDFTLLNATVALMSASLVWFPGIAFLVIVTRLTTRRNRTRVRALRGLGASSIAVRGIQAGEATFLALPGVVLGVIPYQVLARQLTRVPGTAFGFFTEDALLPALQQAGIGLLVLASTAVLAAAQSSNWDHTRSARRRGLLGRASAQTLGGTILVLGLAYLAVLPVTASWLGWPGIFGMWASCGMVACGLALAGPRLVRATSDWLAKRAKGAGVLVGLRAGSTGTTTTTRLASLACVVIVLLLGSLSFISILGGGNYKDWKDELSSYRHIPVVVTDITGTVDLEAVRRVYSLPAAQASSVELGNKTLQVVFATCGDLEGLIGRPTTSCLGDQPQWLNEPGPSLPADKAALNGLTVARESPLAKAPGLPLELDGALLLQPSLLGSVPATGGSAFFVLPESDTLTIAMAAISSTAPGIQFDIGELERNNPDFKRYPNQLEWLIIAAIVSLLVSALAAAATVLGDAEDRAARQAGLQILGAPRRQLISAHIVGIFLPVLVLGWAAALLGWLACRGMNAADDRALVPVSATITTLGLTVVMGLALALVTLPEALRADARAMNARA